MHVLPPKELSKVLEKPKSKGPVWKGPIKDGVTQSLIGKFLVDRERFRLYAIEGWRERDKFNVRIEFGNMWHVYEEELAEHNSWEGKTLTDYARGLCMKYQTEQEQVDHWYNVVKMQFPLYVDHWKKHKDVVSRKPLMQEQVFDVGYELPSGRIVRLRGKYDSVDLVGNGSSAGIWLQENKTKNQINELQIKRQLNFDLQTMLYLVALHLYQIQPKQYCLGGEGIPRGTNILGVRYNVIRRDCPIKRGKGTQGSKCTACKGEGSRIVRGKAENPCSKCKGSKRINAKPVEPKDAFYNRLKNDYIVPNPEEWFARWNVLVTNNDIDVFRRQCLDPILEQMCDWYEHIAWMKNSFDAQAVNTDYKMQSIHYRMPYGTYSSITEGQIGPYDEYLATGSTVGLEKVDTLFRELQ